MVEVVSLMSMRHPPFEALEENQIEVVGVIGVLVHKVQYKMGAATMTVVLEQGSLWREMTGDRH